MPFALSWISFRQSHRCGPSIKLGSEKLVSGMSGFSPGSSVSFYLSFWRLIMLSREGFCRAAVEWNKRLVSPLRYWPRASLGVSCSNVFILYILLFCKESSTVIKVYRFNPVAKGRSHTAECIANICNIRFLGCLMNLSGEPKRRC